MTKPVLRCAIYTRVSSDSGLEQDFNSLDAQRESAEAYIKSQAHEGWKLARDRFDDGGFSGGSMERPALRRLLEKIRDQRIDIVVVYKVDRLTRSLADFAKLVELFDAHKVSFVSVTQSFNTTSSMGRLTLNVLLSFAQFEREVTGERIRDKIAAAKKKGLWMGGVIPFGYRLENRRLFVDEDEAAIVRRIFDLYIAQGSVRHVQEELRRDGIVSRLRLLTTGNTMGGVPFTNGPISHILRNRHYIGELNHRDRSWPGEHGAIIEPTLFDEVQRMLTSRRQARVAKRATSGALLLGKIFNQAGERMSPTYVTKNGVRYRYYISVSAMQSRRGGKTAVQRLPAIPIEAIVVKALMDAADGRQNKHDTIEDSGGAIARKSLAFPERQRSSEGELRARELIDAWLDRVVVHPTSLEIVLLDDRDSDEPARCLTVAWTKPSLNPRREILEPNESDSAFRLLAADERTRLLRSIAIARRWTAELIDGSVASTATIAAREHKSERSIRMTLSLAFLDPALIKAACAGQLPRGYGVSRLAELPPAFDDQWRALGLVRPN
jgi:site-specific DNA recombinase